MASRRCEGGGGRRLGTRGRETVGSTGYLAGEVGEEDTMRQQRMFAVRWGRTG
jgi:hypothetical protein